MPDQLAAQGAGADASGKPPVAANPEIEKITTQFEERLKGMQRVIAEKDTRLAEALARLDQLESAGLPPDEQLQRRERKLAEENQALRAQLELAQLRKEYGKEFDLYEGLLQKQTAKEQLEFAREFLATLAPKEPEKPAAPEVPDVDLNNPMRRPAEGVRLPDGTIMTEEIADRILSAFSGG